MWAGDLGVFLGWICLSGLGGVCVVGVFLCGWVWLG